MNVIKGLVIKDILQLKNYVKSLIIFLIIFSLFGLVNINEGGTVSLLVMLTLGFGMFGIASFSYDEMAKADRYIIALPVNRKEIVRAKYVLVVGATVIGSILGFLLSMIISYIVNKQIFNISEQFTVLLGGILGISFIESIQIPCIYKYGAEKGRFFVFFLIFVLAFLIGGIFYLGEKLNISFGITNIWYIFEQYFSVILIISIIIVYWISYQISLQIYSKKEI